MRGPRLAGLAALAALAVSACGAGPAPAGPAHPAVASTAAGLAASGARTAAPPGLPGCTTATTAAPRLAAARVLVRVGGDPFGVAVPPDGRFAFVSGAGPTVQVLRAGHGLVFTRARAVTVPGAQLAGETLTSGGRYLLAASDRGAVVIDVAAAEQGRPHAVLGTLAAPRGVGAIEVAVTHDSRLAFVSLEYSDEIAVFSLRRALAHGSGRPTTSVPSPRARLWSGWPFRRTGGGCTGPASSPAGPHRARLARAACLLSASGPRPPTRPTRSWPRWRRAASRSG